MHSCTQTTPEPENDTTCRDQNDFATALHAMHGTAITALQRRARDGKNRRPIAHHVLTAAAALASLGRAEGNNLGAREQAEATTRGIWTGRAEADAETGGDVGQENPQKHPCVSSPLINSDDTRRGGVILAERRLPHG